MKWAMRWTIFVAWTVLTVVPAPAQAPNDDAPGRVVGQWPSGDYMKQALDTVLVVAADLTENTEFGYDQNVSILGAALDKGKSVSFDRPFTAGRRYAIIAAGDGDAVDVDVAVYLGDELVSEDQMEDEKAVVEFTPESEDVYTVKLTLYDCSEAFSMCVLTILRDGAWDIPVRYLEQALGRLFDAGITLHTEYGGAAFTHEENQWCLYGAVMEQDDWYSISNMGLEAKQHLFIATGDDDAQDLDLWVLDSREAVLGSDELVDAIPVVELAVPPGERVTVRVQNIASAQPTIVVWAVLDREE